MTEPMDTREDALKERLARIEVMEAEVKKREKTLKEKEKAKKQVLLRLSPTLWNSLAQWAEEDFRSINSQIEYLLSEAVRKKNKKSEI